MDLASPLATVMRGGVAIGQAAHPAVLCAPSTAGQRGANEASRLAKRLFGGFEGSLALRLWDGTTVRLGKAAPHESEPPFTLVCRNPSVVRSMVLGRDPLRLAEAYCRGDIDVEGDFFQALGLKDHLHSIRLSFRDRLGALLSALRLHGTDDAWHGLGNIRFPLLTRAVKSHSRKENRAAISFHYDVSNEFYRLWLEQPLAGLEPKLAADVLQLIALRLIQCDAVSPHAVMPGRPAHQSAPAAADVGCGTGSSGWRRTVRRHCARSTSVPIASGGFTWPPARWTSRLAALASIRSSRPDAIGVSGRSRCRGVASQSDATADPRA